MHSWLAIIKKMSEEILLCSDCFKDESLKINAYHIGVSDEKELS